MNTQSSISRPTIFLTVLAALLTACGGEQETSKPDVAAATAVSELLPHQQMAKDILRELVEIDTTQAGNTTIAAEAIAARLLAEGFSEEDIHVIGPTPGSRQFGRTLSGARCRSASNFASRASRCRRSRSSGLGAGSVRAYRTRWLFHWKRYSG